MDAAVLAWASNGVTAIGAWLLSRRRSQAEVDNLRAQARKTEADADATASAVWRELLIDMRQEVARLGRENAAMAADAKSTKEELGVLRRRERENSTDNLLVKAKLVEQGLEMPVVRPPTLDHTRSTDYEEERHDRA